MNMFLNTFYGTFGVGNAVADNRVLTRAVGGGYESQITMSLG